MIVDTLAPASCGLERAGAAPQIGPTLHQVVLQPSGHRFAVQAGQTILDAGLEAGRNLPYSCRAGNCRTCRGRIVEGSVDYNGTHLAYLPVEQRTAGFALLCKAKPLGDLVVEVAEIALDRIVPKVVPCRVKRVTRVAPDVAIVDLRLPMNENFLFNAGQFVDLLLPDGGTRSYSIATTPVAAGVIDLELHIRHTPGGRFTDHVFEGLKEGDLLKFRGPLGGFTLREDSDRPIIFVAAGTGFAPIFSMINHALQKKTDRPMTLYWGGRAEQDLYRDMPPIPSVPVLSHSAWSGRTGFVHRAVLEDHADLSRFQVYACGSPAMVEAARRDFAKHGLPETQFFADSFLTKADLQ